jgi:uncharacterized protein (DUF433 family)
LTTEGIPEHTRDVAVDWRERIWSVPGVRSGQPLVRGMRLTVKDVLGYLASGMSVAEVLDDFPELTPEDIQAVLAFGWSHGAPHAARRF